MKIRKFKIKPSQWEKIPDREQVLFLTLGHIANELSALQKLLLVSMNTANTTKIEKEAQAFLSLLIAKFFIVKICAAWDTIKPQTKTPKFAYIGQDSEISLLLRNLKSYFSKANILRYVRDKVGAHYDLSAAAGSLSSVSKQSANLYMSEEFGNSLYGISEELFFQTIAKQAVGAETAVEVVNRMFKESIEVARWLTAVVQSINMKIAKRYLFEDWIKHKPDIVEINDTNVFELKMPFFINVKKLATGRNN